MRFAGGECLADLGNEYRAFGFGDTILPLFRCAFRKELFQFLGSNEENIIGQKRFDVVVSSGDEIFGLFQLTEYFADCVFQCFHIPFFFGDYFFPIPLIDINRMDIIGIFIPADRAHIGVKSLAGVEAVVFQSVSFPFGERVYDLGRCVLLFFDTKRNRAFHTI